ACRGAHRVHLRVDDNIPATLLTITEHQQQHPERRVFSRVPRPRAHRVTWNLPTLDLLAETVDVWAAMAELHVFPSFNGSLEGQVWPSRLSCITFSILSSFNKP
ncbi:unnamed protein product, partial [Scytosiphon promiscuus]